MDIRPSRFGALLPDNFYSRVKPTSFEKPFLVASSKDAAKLIGIKKIDPEVFCGKKLLPEADYIAGVYSGHQFGSYVPQLGDGRAILIGEANGYEVQLKGAGKTPYSRFGDGHAVLRSCIREFLCSEAMHYLGIPTTRALCVVGGDEDVQRECVEKAAMLTRLAPSHIRFGHFEYFNYTGQYDKLKELADFTIKNYFTGASYAEFFEEVVLRTARLIAKWQAVGFAHGVMNTDNMSILGLTFDYGPFGFMEAYDPGYVCNHSDHGGRYAFDQQPGIALWNLQALAQSLTPLLGWEESVKIMQKYQPELIMEYSGLIITKLGFREKREEDLYLVQSLLQLMERHKTDYTIFFRNLGSGIVPEEFAGWRELYIKRLEQEPFEGWQEQMNRVNPKYILRNYMAEIAIKKAKEGDYSEVNNLLELLATPYDEQPDKQAYFATTPEWAQNLEISCSS